MPANRRIAFTFGILILGSVAASRALAQSLPPDQTIYYAIHQTPSDPASPVDFVIKLRLRAQAHSGNSVGWEVDRITFRDPGASPSLDKRWVEADPVVNSSDGLWWVNHADKMNPHRSEFVMPPNLEGRAVAADVEYADLDYDFVGVAYTVPPQPTTPPYTVTAVMDYVLNINDEDDPDDDDPDVDGDDDPVDVPPNEPL